MKTRVRGQTYPAIGVTVKTAAGAVVDLTGATAKFYLFPLGMRTPLVNGAAAVVDVPAQGHVKYTPLAGDTSGLAPGTETFGWFEITLAGGAGVLYAPQNELALQIKWY
jgi:hypothetical protein